MKIMMIDKVRGCAGTYGGAVNLNLILGDIKLSGYDDGSEYILSLRDEIFVMSLGKKDGPYPNFTGLYELSNAKALIIESLSNGGHRLLKISIEGANTADFIELYDTIYERLGVPHEHIPTPKRRFEQPSFVRGIRNDLRELGEILSNRWKLIKESMRLRRTT